jgi:DNA polymerase-3 subunit delta
LIYAIYGTDDFSVSEKLKELKKGWGDDETLAINTTVLEGREVELPLLLNDCRSIPFMGVHRLVLVRGLLARFERKKGREVSALSEWDSLAGELAGMPTSTELVFLDGDITGNNPLLRRLAPVATVHCCRLPAGADLERWILSRTAVRGGRMSPRAAVLLGELAGDSLWALTHEVDKLCLYAKGRLITDKDVKLLTSQARDANVFALVDAIVEMRVSTAMQLLHRLIDEGASPTYLLSMLARQLRLMVQAQELRATDLSVSAKREALGVSAKFRIDKLMDQSGKYSMSRLTEVYERLLETDLAIKTGRWRDDLALDLLVAELSARRKVKT